MPQGPHEIGGLLIRFVREISEASDDPRLLGLRGYPEYVQRKQLKYQSLDGSWEQWITIGLADRLFAHGIPAFAEVAYPALQVGGRKFWCDLVVMLDGRRFLWVECKPAWSRVLQTTSRDSKEYDYSGARTKAGGWQQSLRAVHDDVKKLSYLSPPAADSVGMLLVGLDRKSEELSLCDPRSPVPQELSNWSCVHGAEAGECWDDPHPERAQAGFRERAWFWYRDAGSPTNA